MFVVPYDLYVENVTHALLAHRARYRSVDSLHIDTYHQQQNTQNHQDDSLERERSHDSFDSTEDLMPQRGGFASPLDRRHGGSNSGSGRHQAHVEPQVHQPGEDYFAHGHAGGAAGAAGGAAIENDVDDASFRIAYIDAIKHSFSIWV